MMFILELDQSTLHYKKTNDTDFEVNLKLI